MQTQESHHPVAFKVHLHNLEGLILTQQPFGINTCLPIKPILQVDFTFFEFLSTGSLQSTFHTADLTFGGVLFFSFCLFVVFVAVLLFSRPRAFVVSVSHLDLPLMIRFLQCSFSPGLCGERFYYLYPGVSRFFLGLHFIPLRSHRTRSLVACFFFFLGRASRSLLVGDILR